MRKKFSAGMELSGENFSGGKGYFTWEKTFLGEILRGGMQFPIERKLSFLALFKKQ